MTQQRTPPITSLPPTEAPLALACWDCSWPLGLDDRDATGVIERRLDQTLARGFNALRVDPYPHLMALPRKSGVHPLQHELTMAASPRRHLAAETVTLDMRRAVKRLLQGAHERGLKLWLTSFFAPDSHARRSTVRRPGDFIDVWAETLALMREWGVLDSVVAVDFCRHFPFPPAAHGAIQGLFRRTADRPLPSRWSAAQERRVESYLLAVPQGLRALFPDIRFGVSTATTHLGHLRQMDTSELDFLDLALWLDDDPRFRLVSGADLPQTAAMRRRIGRPWRRTVLAGADAHWRRRFATQLNRSLAFVQARKVQAVVGEGYLALAETPPQLPASWAEFTEEVVLKALATPVGAITPSSLAHPLCDWLWHEKAWLADINRMIVARPG